MAPQESSRFCPNCDQQRLVRRPGMTIHWLIHLVLFLSTFGVWIVIWLFDAAAAYSRLWRCSVCGAKMPENKALEMRQMEQGSFQKCPYCAELIKSDAVICKHCGKELPLAVNHPLNLHQDFAILRSEAVNGADKIVEVNGKRFNVKIPAGIEDGTKLRLEGKGSTRDVKGESIFGDLFLKILINNDEIETDNRQELFGQKPAQQSVLTTLWNFTKRPFTAKSNREQEKNEVSDKSKVAFHKQKDNELIATPQTAISMPRNTATIYSSSAKLCPKCGKPMERQMATKGESKGKWYYVCPNVRECQQFFPVE